jgi:hypothetical protein
VTSPQYDPWGAPGGAPVSGWQAQQVLPAAEPGRVRKDLVTAGLIVVGLVFLGAPVGLLWSVLAPHYTAVREGDGYTIPNIESDKSAVGADGTLLLIMLGVGLLCGALAWLFARRSGPYTVAALLLGGTLAALIAGHVGLMPGQKESFAALRAGDSKVELFLGKREVDAKGNPIDEVHLRTPWSVVAWPVGALLAFVGPAFVRPEDLD